MKKALACILATLLLLSFQLSAVAASGINSAEKQILTALSTGTDGYAALDEYQNIAKNYFNKDGVDVSQSQADAMCVYIKETNMISGNYSSKKKAFDFYSLSDKDKIKVLQNGIDACAVIGLTLAYDQSSQRMIIRDEKGDIIFDALPALDVFSGKATNGSQIKKTGTDYTSLYVVLSILAGAGVISAILLKRGNKKIYGFKCF